MKLHTERRARASHHRGDCFAIIRSDLPSSSWSSPWCAGRTRRRRRRQSPHLSCQPTSHCCLVVIGMSVVVIPVFFYWTWCCGHQVSCHFWITASMIESTLTQSLHFPKFNHRRIFWSKYKGDPPSSIHQVLVDAPVGVDSIIPFADTPQEH